MELISVDSAKRTATTGVLVLSITADIEDGAGQQSGIPYGWDQNMRDPHGLYPQIDAWMAAHPDFPITAYVAPTPVPSDYVLSKRQLCAVLILNVGKDDPDGFIREVIGAIPDVTQRALALNDWDNAPFYTRSNALFSDPNLLAAAGMTSDQVDALWLAAKDLPA